tara:strand:- start:242 stop:439 length:198 start_codon:yes stop_codon:yes gene_type:complete
MLTLFPLQSYENPYSLTILLRIPTLDVASPTRAALVEVCIVLTYYKILILSNGATIVLAMHIDVL